MAMLKMPVRIPDQQDHQTLPQRPDSDAATDRENQRETIGETPTYHEFTQISETIDLPKDFGTITPGAKVKLLQAAHIDRTLLTRYLTLGDEINILRAAKHSLPAVRSGVASYMRFCALLGRPSFPPTTDAAPLWSATFNPGKSFGQYLTHLQKASILLDHPLDWLTPGLGIRILL